MVKQEITNGAITKAIENTVSNGNELQGVTGCTGTGDCYDPNHRGPEGHSGYDGPPGAKSNSYKYHFKGKYPKPR